jgi:hypothetical protein
MKMRGAKIGTRILYPYSDTGKDLLDRNLGSTCSQQSENGKSDLAYDSVYPRVKQISYNIVVQMNGSRQNLP